jgi:hypothetical protein
MAAGDKPIDIAPMRDAKSLDMAVHTFMFFPSTFIRTRRVQRADRLLTNTFRLLAAQSRPGSFPKSIEEGAEQSVRFAKLLVANAGHIAQGIDCDGAEPDAPTF